MLADTLRAITGLRLVDDHGNEETLELLPPATEEEIEQVEAALSVPLPSELRAALRCTAGFASGPIESLGFLDAAGFGMDDVFPNPYPLGHDGFGNYWILAGRHRPRGCGLRDLEIRCGTRRSGGRSAVERPLAQGVLLRASHRKRYSPTSGPHRSVTGSHGDGTDRGPSGSLVDGSKSPIQC